MSKIVDFQTAVSAIPSGSTLAIVGVIGWTVPEKLLRALGERYLDSGSPGDLTLYVPCFGGDNGEIKGIDNLMHDGMTKRLITGSFINPPDPKTGERPRSMQQVKADKIEAYTFHIGVMMHWLREIARRSPGYLTEVGLGTFVDPDLGGGKVTPRTTEDIVEKIEFRGKPHLFFPSLQLDYGIIRATSADKHGNLCFEDDPLVSANLSIALAVKACGGKVVAQVKRIYEPGERHAHLVKVPGVLVDHVVVDPDQKLVTGIQDDPRFLGEKRLDPRELPPLTPGAPTIIARRSAELINKNELTIYGFGASSSIPTIFASEGRFDGEGIYDYPATTEHGSYGGIVTSGWQFSANYNPDALIDGVTQFDAIHAGLCKTCALAFAQFDASGNINVSKFGSANPGSGGFIDIAHNASHLIFNGTFTTGGLEVEAKDGRLTVLREGKVSKFVRDVEQVTYPLLTGVRDRGQTAHIVTERAVFAVSPEGLELKEIAPGIDPRSQVLDLMDFAPVRVPETIPLMKSELFR
jgi:propionate CoA-transferase